MLTNIIYAAAQALILLLVAPLFTGLSRKLRAKIHTRKGPSVLQDYRDFFKLFSRQDVWPKEAGFVFRSMPVVFLASYFVAAMILPLIGSISPLPFLAELITFIYLLAVPRFIFCVASLDSASSFAGLGGVRELLVASLVEPALMLSLVVLSLLAGSTSLMHISAMSLTGNIALPVAYLLAVLAFAFCVYVELGKLPYDLAEAEQELQEGPLTEYSGPSLAMLKSSLGLKQVLMISLFISLVLPFGSPETPGILSFIVGMLILLIKILLIFVLVSFIENSVARVRYRYISHQSWISVGVAALAFIFYLVGM